jgi:hypothetical protein
VWFVPDRLGRCVGRLLFGERPPAVAAGESPELDW